MTALAVTAAGYLACRTVLLHMATALALGWAMAQTLELVGTGEAWWHSWSLGLATGGAAWAVLAAAGALSERTLGMALGGAMVYIGGEGLTFQDSPAEAGYTVVGLLVLAALAGYLRTRVVAVLAVGVIALASIVPQMITDYTDGALGAAGALLVSGLSIVGASVLGLRLRHEVAQAPVATVGGLGHPGGSGAPPT